MYAGTRDNLLYAIYADTGEQKWSYDAGSDITGGAVLSPDGATIFFGTNNNGFHAVDTDDGAEKWSFNVAEGRMGSFEASPSIYKDIVIATTNHGRVYAFNSENGDLKWQYPSSGKKGVGEFEEAGAILDDLYYVGSGDGDLYAINVKSGRKESPETLRHSKMIYWDPDDDNRDPESIRTSVVRAGDYVFFGNDAEEFYLYQKSRIRCVYVGKGRYNIRGVIAADESVVIFTDTSGQLQAGDTARERCQDANRKRDEKYDRIRILWQAFTDSVDGRSAKVIGGPIIHGKRIFAIDEFGKLYIFDKATGNELFKINLSDSATRCSRCKAKPAIDGDTLFAGTRNGDVVAVRLPPED